MPWFCIKCESRVDEGLVQKDTFICPECNQTLTKNNLFWVTAKHHFARETEEIRTQKARCKRKKQKGLLKQQRRLERQKGR